VTAPAGWGEVRYLTAGGRPGGRRAGSRAAAALTVAAALAAALAVALGLAACSSAASASGAGTAGTSCGTARTAAGVVVRIDVAQGTVNCATALRVEAGYATAIKDGELRGNGGGAPVTVDGWTCESYSAVQAARTGNASECHTANAEVVAVLALASGSGPADSLSAGRLSTGS
jgi:putative hemolysin